MTAGAGRMFTKFVESPLGIQRGYTLLSIIIHGYDGQAFLGGRGLILTEILLKNIGLLSTVVADTITFSSLLRCIENESLHIRLPLVVSN